MLQKQLKEELKKAMLSKDALRLSVLRGLLSSFTNELVAKGRKPQEELSDDEALAVISRAVKQRKDSIEQFTKGNRPDLASNEQKELDILSTYMPAQLSEEEVKKAVAVKKAELGITDKAQIGNLMKAVMNDLKGKADGALVKKAVDNSF